MRISKADISVLLSNRTARQLVLDSLSQRDFLYLGRFARLQRLRELSVADCILNREIALLERSEVPPYAELLVVLAPVYIASLDDVIEE